MSGVPDYAIVIPARLDSQRLPGKALLDLGGQPMVCRVLDRARASGAAEVAVATDDPRIAEAVENAAGMAIMTVADHRSGSDRIAECARKLDWPGDRLIVNLQGDEPLMPPECLDQAASLLADDADAVAATLCWPIEEPAQVGDPNVVKVVCDERGRALCFSRSPLPYPRGWRNATEAMADGVSWYRHIGLYAYRNAELQAFTRLEPTPLERAERLEQMRILESGGRIRVARACQAIPPGVDTSEDLERIRTEFAKTD